MPLRTAAANPVDNFCNAREFVGIITSMEKRYPWELRDPGAAVDDIAKRHILRPGQVLVGLFELPASSQRLLDTVLAYEGDQAPTDIRECALLVRTAARDVFGGRLIVGEPRHAFVSLIVRNGPLRTTDEERRWLLGWVHASHRLPVYTGELFSLTEQGWLSAHEEVGYHPALAA